MPKRLSYDKNPLTKKAFEQLLRKAAQPVAREKSVPKETRTSVVHPSDGYSGKCKSLGKTEGKED